MKTEQEIRAHRNDLRTAQMLPCDCDAGGCSGACVTGRYMMAATEAALSWVIGENDGLQWMVDEIAKEVKEAKESN